MKAFYPFLLVFTAVVCLGQNRFERYTVESGISQNSVLAILQDRRGYLWLGTESGLNRFDGYSFEKFFHDPRDSTSLASDQVWALAEDNQHRIWVGHARGISYFDDRTQKFINFLEEDELFISTVYKDSAGNLWFGTTKSGLIFVNTSSLDVERFHNATQPDSRFDSTSWNISANYITAIIEYDEGLLIGTRGAGFWVFNKGNFSRLNGERFKNDFFELNAVWSFALDDTNNMYAATLKGMCVIGVDNTVNVFPLGELPELPGKSPLTRLCFNSDMTGLWVASYGDGLLYFDIKKNQFGQSKNELSNQSSLTGNLVYSLLLDDFDNLWVGTWGSGVNKLNKMSGFFSTYNSSQGFEDEFITGVVKKDNHTVLVSSYTGGVYEGSLKPDGSGFGFRKLFPSERQDRQYIRTITHKNNIVYLGLDGGGVAYRDLKLNEGWHFYTKIPFNTNSLNYMLIEALHMDNYQYLWVGTWGGGLKRINTKIQYGTEGSVENIKLNSEDKGVKVAAIYEDNDGHLWVGTDQGVFKSDFPISNSDGISFRKFGGYLTHCFLQGKDRIWIGTEHGLFYTKGDVMEYEPILGSNIINSMVADSTGSIWITTNNGLFEMKDELVSHYTASDGLQSNEFNAQVGIDLGSQILIGGINGLNSFNPYGIKLNTLPGKVAITRVFINNKRRVDNPVSLVLTPKDKVVEFEFTSFDFTNPISNKFAYKLEGFDDEWVEAPTRTATYTNLDAGDYNFKVKTNVINGSLYELPLLIRPPLWKTWWAYSAYSFVIIVIVFVARKSIVNRERLKARIDLDNVELTKLKELDDFKSRFFANISHEFRTPLTVILGNTEELIEKSVGEETQILESIQHSGHTALNLVNQLLDLSKIDAGKLDIHLSKVQVISFLKEHIEMFQSLANQRDITLNTTCPEEEVELYLDTAILEKIVINLISNAIKYSNPGDSVDVHISIDENKVCIKVIDTGIGISKENQKMIFNRFFRIADHDDGTGIGLSLTKELVTLHKGTITVESEEGNGACFEVTISTGKNAFPEAEYLLVDYESAHPGISEMPRASTTEHVGLKVEKETPVLLIVEDNHELQRYLKRNLESEYHILLSESGEDGLEKSNFNVPDIILSDWMMPGMNGSEMCKRIKSGEVTSHIPVVLLTAKADLDSKIKGLDLGADDYLTKPFEMRELRARLRNLIIQREKLKEKYASLSEGGYRKIKAISIDEVFLNKFYETIERHLSNSEMGVAWLSQKMGVSRVQLHRKLTALLGRSAGEIIRDYKLNRAADLLRQNAGNVSEVAYQVGFENLSYFTKVFKQKYSVNPSEFV